MWEIVSNPLLELFLTLFVVGQGFSPSKQTPASKNILIPLTDVQVSINAISVRVGFLSRSDVQI